MTGEPTRRGAGRISVLVLAPYPLRRAPSQRYRFEQVLPALREQGFDITVRPLLRADDYDVLYSRGATARKAAALLRGLGGRLADVVRARRHAVVFIHREAFPVGPAFIERALWLLRIPYVFDFDDAIYLPNVSPSNRLAAPLKHPGKVRAAVAHAALVTAGNEYLATWARQLNDRVLVIPTTIDTGLYQARDTPERSPVCVGWTGSPTTTPYLRDIAGVLGELQRTHGIRVRVIGDPSLRLPGVKLEALPWREATEVEDLAAIDIGVMPLPDQEWARGKCGAKALQYMALGIPTVMSPVGVNRQIADGRAALLASSADQWRVALTRLIEDPAMRRELGQAGRRRVVERYSHEANVGHYVTALTEAAAWRPSRGRPTKPPLRRRMRVSG